MSASGRAANAFSVHLRKVWQQDHGLSCAVWAALLSSVTHYSHNVWFFEHYPEPTWLNAHLVDAFWFPMTALGLWGWWQVNRPNPPSSQPPAHQQVKRWPWAALWGYALLHLLVLGHYRYAPWTQIAATIHLWIVLEAAAGLWLLVVLLRRIGHASGS